MSNINPSSVTLTVRINCNLILIQNADIKFSQDDIESAIDEIDKDAASTENDISASVLKECKNNLLYPVYLICPNSPSTLKLYQVT